MKPKVLFLLFMIFFFSCKTEDVVETKKIEPVDIEESVTKSDPLEIIPFELFYEIDEIPLVETDKIEMPEYSYVELLSKDPFLRMIDLKKRFYSFIDLKETGFPQNEVTEIYTAENHIYIGTLKGAVIRYNLDNKTFNIIKDGYNSLQNNSISDIILINGTLLIATYSGLYSYNPVTDKLKYHRSTFKDNRLKTMTVFENDVYLGTTGGQILKWNFDDFLLLGSINNIPINIISIIDDRVVIGTAGKGVFEYNLEKDLILPINIVNDQLSNKNITAISYFDESFWLGTFGEGIYVFDYSLNKISEHYKKRIILSSAQSEENIYFGTHHKGLFFYNKFKKKWYNWELKNGLPSLYLPSLYYKDKNIFISIPDKGIVFINEKIHESDI